MEKKEVIGWHANREILDNISTYISETVFWHERTRREKESTIRKGLSAKTLFLANTGEIRRMKIQGRRNWNKRRMGKEQTVGGRHV